MRGSTVYGPLPLNCRVTCPVSYVYNYDNYFPDTELLLSDDNDSTLSSIDSGKLLYN